jgi:hypothetical protein
MHHSSPVRGSERVHHLPQDLHRLGHRQLPLPCEALTKGVALEVRHDVIQESVRPTRIEERKDVGVLEVGGDPHFLKEAVRAQGGGQLRAEDLQGDQALVAKVLGEVDRSHTAFTEFPLDLVAVRERCSQTVDGLSQANTSRISVLRHQAKRDPEVTHASRQVLDTMSRDAPPPRIRYAG